MNASLLDDLTEYISVLPTSMEKTKHAQDRSADVEHLAAAALILQSLHQSNFQCASQQVARKQRQFGWFILAQRRRQRRRSRFRTLGKIVEPKNRFERSRYCTKLGPSLIRRGVGTCRLRRTAKSSIRVRLFRAFAVQFGLCLRMCMGTQWERAHPSLSRCDARRLDC
jgi:hypothetical protein